MLVIDLEVPATFDNFDEEGYLAANPDVAADLELGRWPNALEHFKVFGHKENRSLRRLSEMQKTQIDKIARIKPLLRLDMPHQRRGSKYDFLTPELRAETAIVDTSNVSENAYDQYIIDLINAVDARGGVVLDCGAGRRNVYYSNVVNYEIVDYDTVDIVGVAEVLPFKNDSFDGVISIAVLEHLRHPFRAAAEIIRVLKPGGRLICCVPFLQPLHGYPHHYYNMSAQGLRALFERDLEIDDHKVSDALLPIWTLTWIVQSWANGLSGGVRQQFLDTPVRALLTHPTALLEERWVRELSAEKNFELASATMLFAHKRPLNVAK
jgi:SAM-dependent methyltransferase